ncbi:MAG: CDP-alcohol phosphatidyltransferase family protein [Acidobacteria bacterium]|nr:CDP-alcohol phosphatidyltransferase family protein [Acidobacteriota bacterium]
MKTDVKLHIRENRGLLAIPEKKALNLLARNMPRWIHSDHMTLLGLFAMIAAGASFWMSGIHKPVLFLVVFFLAVNWFGDSLDGTLARFRNRQRPRYGYYVDHVIDLIGTAALLGGIALSGYMSPIMAVALLAAFALVEAEVFLATHVRQVFRLATFGFGPTELRVVLSAGALVLMVHPYVQIGGFGPYLLFDVGGALAIAGLITAFTFSSIRNTRILYQMETR